MDSDVWDSDLDSDLTGRGLSLGLGRLGLGLGLGGLDYNTVVFKEFPHFLRVSVYAKSVKRVPFHGTSVKRIACDFSTGLGQCLGNEI